METERRYINLDKAQVGIETRGEGDDAAGHIVGYAAVYYDGTRATEYEIWDGVFERIMPGAFDAAVKSDDVRGLFNHDPNMLLGRTSAGTLAITSDDTGLHYDITRSGTSVDNDVAQWIARGDLQGSSFAFRVTDEEWRKEDGGEVRQINGVQVFDVGPVTFPAYETTTTGVRSSEARASYDQWRQSQKPQGMPIDILTCELDLEELQ